MILDHLTRDCPTHGLFVMGHMADEDGGVILIGADRGFWPGFSQSTEYHDKQPDPVDRWSKRIITAMARQHGATALYPSDGPPYAPFIAWALATRRFWQSPTGMMIHDTAGLMISIRGAIRTQAPLPAVDARPSPCDNCTDQPCATACPVTALSLHTPYDVPRCKSHLSAPEGAECMSQGCSVRRLCPVSERFDRPAAQSAFHMKAFMPCA